jgi:hypothetical protein
MFNYKNTITSIPSDLGGDPSKPLGGSVVTIVQHVLPYFSFFKSPLKLS